MKLCKYCGLVREVEVKTEKTEECKEHVRPYAQWKLFITLRFKKAELPLWMYS
jgi:hypothetical protein